MYWQVVSEICICKRHPVVFLNFLIQIYVQFKISCLWAIIMYWKVVSEICYCKRQPVVFLNFLIQIYVQFKICIIFMTKSQSFVFLALSNIKWPHNFISLKLLLHYTVFTIMNWKYVIFEICGALFCHSLLKIFLIHSTNYGHLRTAFFARISNFWAWADKLFGTFGMYLAKLQQP